MEESLERLRLNATKCRDLASTAVTSGAKKVLSDLARDYDHKAAVVSDRAGASRRRAFTWPVA